MIDPEGQQLGIMGLPEARKAAEDMGLDLIEVAPNAAPPVCRIMDYGKFRYEQRKKAKDAQKKSKQTEMKMLRVRPNTDDHDLDFKMRNAIKFLGKGNKVKFTVIFRGPELRHKEIGERQLNLFATGCKEIAQVDQPPRMEGRRMTMILEPRPEAMARIAAERAKAAAEGRRHEYDEEEPQDDSHLEDEDDDAGESEVDVAEAGAAVSEGEAAGAVEGDAPAGGEVVAEAALACRAVRQPTDTDTARGFPGPRRPIHVVRGAFGPYRRSRAGSARHHKKARPGAALPAGPLRGAASYACPHARSHSGVTLVRVRQARRKSMGKVKCKTRKAASKRFKFTATGRVLVKKTQQSSNTPMSKSSRRTKRALRRGGELLSGEVKQVKGMVPYWSKSKRA